MCFNTKKKNKKKKTSTYSYIKFTLNSLQKTISPNHCLLRPSQIICPKIDIRSLFYIVICFMGLQKNVY